MVFWSIVRKVIGIAAIAAMVSGPAAASDVGPFGGKGGKAFRDECAPGEYLVGLDGRTGGWVDAVGAICARWDAGAKSFKGARIPGYHGNLGGSPERQKCAFDLAVGSVLIDLKRSDDHLVSGIGLDCFGALPPYQQVSSYAFGNLGEFVPLGGRDAVMKRLTCPAGELAVGIFGRSGDSLDAIGLVCGPAPAEAALPAPGPKIKLPVPIDASTIKLPPKVVLRPKGEAQPAPAPAAGEYVKPLTAGHERLNACLFLPNDDCGEPAAQEFCQTSGHGYASGFEVERGAIRSETIYGEFCRKDCRVFVKVTCGG